MGLLRVLALVFRLLRRLSIFGNSHEWRQPAIYDNQGRSGHMHVGAYARQWIAMSRLCPSVFLNMKVLDMLFVPHATEVEYERRTREMLRSDISSDSDEANLSSCCLPLPLR